MYPDASCIISVIEFPGRPSEAVHDLATYSARKSSLIISDELLNSIFSFCEIAEEINPSKARVRAENFFESMLNSHNFYYSLLEFSLCL